MDGRKVGKLHCTAFSTEEKPLSKEVVVFDYGVLDASAEPVVAMESAQDVCLDHLPVEAQYANPRAGVGSMGSTIFVKVKREDGTEVGVYQISVMMSVKKIDRVIQDGLAGK